MDGKKSILVILPTIAVFASLVVLVKYWPSEKKEEVSSVREESEVLGDNAAGEGNNKIGLANPAAVYCEEQGGTSVIEETEQGQVGICRFANDSFCDEWDFFHRKCFGEAPKITINKEATHSALLKTSEGDLEIELLADRKPQTVNNFIFLASQGFYDGIVFHRVIKDFMVQTGDPEGTGRGGPGYKFDDELPIVGSYERGMVAMANSGPNTNGSQFFIVTQSTDLPKNYVIFGRVSDGFDVLDKIAATPVSVNSMGEMSAPITPPIIESLLVFEDGKEISNRPF